MKLSPLFRKEKDKIRCLACNHYCLIEEGKIGICRVRKNVKGKLYCLVYDKIVARHVDPIEKKPLYHFLPGTFAYSIGTLGCNFACDFCQNFDISKEWLEVVGENVKPEEIVKEALRTRCKSIAYTYNEPAVFVELVHDTAVLAKKAGLKNILVTNGYMSKEALEYLDGLIDAANIDLKGDEEFYRKFCKASVSPVKETIKLMHKKGIHVEITTLVIPGENDDSESLEEIAKFIASISPDIPWHISRFFPMYKMLKKQPTPLETLKQAKAIGKKYLKYVHVGNV